MFVNYSNHPSSMWGREQLEAAQQWGEIVDYPFPSVSARATEEEIDAMADDIVSKLLLMQPDAVMCQGEFTLSYKVINGLMAAGIKVVAACSERKTEERRMEDGSIKKTAVFCFVQFREYER